MKKSILTIALVAGILFPSMAWSQEKFNISFQPIAAAIGFVNAELAYKVADHWTVGPEIGFWNLKIKDIEIRASGFSARARYSFEPALTTSTWFLMGGVGYSSLDASITEDSVKYTGDAKGWGVHAGGGYHWFWDTFNMSLGGTLGTSAANEFELKDSSGNKYRDDATNPRASLGIEYSLGWKF